MNQEDDKDEDKDPDLCQSLSKNEESDSALTTWFDGHVIASTHLVYAQVVEAQVIEAQVVEEDYEAIEAQDFVAEAIKAQEAKAQDAEDEAPTYDVLEDRTMSEEDLHPVIIGEANMIAEDDPMKDDDEDEDFLQYWSDYWRILLRRYRPEFFSYYQDILT